MVAGEDTGNHGEQTTLDGENGNENEDENENENENEESQLFDEVGMMVDKAVCVLVCVNVTRQTRPKGYCVVYPDPSSNIMSTDVKLWSRAASGTTETRNVQCGYYTSRA
jgi:hypothetical protein